MPFKFIHTADIHLDSPLRTLALRNPELADLISTATRRTFIEIVDLCLEEQVNALLIAGDLFDGSQSSVKTARFLSEQLHRLDAAGILVFMIRGNHDALLRLGEDLNLPASVKIFSGKAEAVAVPRNEGQQPVFVHGVSFAKTHAPESLLPKYRTPVDAALNIALMHTSLAGAEGHDVYAPCKLSDLLASGHQYWALGHIHKRAVYAQEGRCVVMPGIPQGRHINEAGEKSVTLVNCTDDGQLTLVEHHCNLAQFVRLEANIDKVDNWPDVVSTVTAVLQSARQQAATEHLVARIHITGATPINWLLRRDLDLLKAELDQRVSVSGGLWIEKIDIHCQTHSVEQQGSAATQQNPLLELAELIDQQVLSSDAYQQDSQALLESLRSQLPRECRDIFGIDEESARRSLEELCRVGVEEVMAQLHSSRSEG